MKAGFSFIICIIDRSGSMQSMRADAIGGFNAFLEEQRKHPDGALLTLVLFNDGYEVVHDAVPLPDVAPLDEATYIPSGSTALLDAVGRSIHNVGLRLAATPEEDRPEKVIVAILTDGEENASRDYALTTVAGMIAHQQDVYQWEFVFLAANQDAITTAQSLSIQAQDAINFSATSTGVREACKTMCYEVTKRRSRR
jgi:hypothetical protein